MNNVYKDIELFVQQVKSSKTIVLAGHTSPDGDAVSACLALGMSLQKMDKNPIILLEDFNNNLKYLKGQSMIYKDDYDKLQNIDLFITLDCGDIQRLGNAKSIFEKAKNTVNIDHHISNNNFANLNIVNYNSSSTSEIIFEIIKYINNMDFNIATAIYTGIVFDTSGFKHSCTTKRTHQIAGELLNIGVDTTFIHSTILTIHSLNNAKLLAKSINNLYIENDVVISTLTNEEIVSLNCLDKDTGGIIQYLLDIQNINVAVFLHEKEDKSIKVSFRSKTIDVNKIANLFGGGGHTLASGAVIQNMTLEQAKNSILEQIKNA